MRDIVLIILVYMYGGMMLDYLGEVEAGKTIIESIEKTLSNKQNRTKDLAGSSNTKECTNAVLSNLK